MIPFCLQYSTADNPEESKSVNMVYHLSLVESVITKGLLCSYRF
uniref:Uncharacterized protein n=1 Tax=Faecalibaculum rodentium TaxID=1702221 RepID=A0A140DU66_9FIRM|nr:hypothetical protein AALO17_10590 [Faecalibaculum rodentium]